MKKLAWCLWGSLFLPQGIEPTYAAAAPVCPSLENVKQVNFKNFRRYDRGEEANLYAYDATVKLEDGWWLRMQFYSTTPSTIEKANAMKQSAREPRGPHRGGEGMQWFCGYEIPREVGIKMVALIAEKW